MVTNHDSFVKIVFEQLQGMHICIQISVYVHDELS